MSDKLVCPFCGEPLCQTYSFNPTQFWCSNYKDPKHPINVQGTKELWQELITTRKALDLAIDRMEDIKNHTLAGWIQHDILETFEQINEIKGGKDENV